MRDRLFYHQMMKINLSSLSHKIKILNVVASVL